WYRFLRPAKAGPRARRNGSWAGELAMDEIFGRFVNDMVARVSGPLHFRLVLQPAMAAFFAIRSGLADARAGRPPYFWALFTDPSHREAMLKDGWKAVGKVFVLAFVLDVIYQIIASHFVYPGEA